MNTNGEKQTFKARLVGFDCSVVVIAALISLVARGELLGVREGTVIAAVFVGIIIKPISKCFLARLKSFLGDVKN